jgi:DNA-binding MarR family transcriptional regulator
MASSSASAARARAADAPTRRVMDALRRLVRVLGASARGPAGRRGPTGAQLFVLRQIAAVPGLSISELSARTLAGQSTVSEVVTRLVARGLVTRRPSSTDARQGQLALSARGRATVRDTEPTAQERLAEGLAALSVAERDGLARGLDRWLEAAGLAELPATMFFEDDGTATRRRATARPTAKRATG